MRNALKLLLHVFIIFSVFVDVKSTECSKLYFTSFFGKDSNCQKYDYYDVEGCDGVNTKFFKDCAAEANRKLITALNSDSKNYFTCVPGVNLFNCARLIDNNVVTLNKTHRYGFREFFRQRIEPYKECNKNSIFIFLIGIPCQNISQYPDLDELVGSGLKETQKYFIDQNLHGIIVWTDTDDSNFIKCNNSGKHLKFSPVNFLESKFVQYDVFDDYIHINDDVREICETPIPHYPIDYHNNLVKPDPILKQAAIGIISGVILFLILLWIIFWTQRVWRRYQESKIEEFADQHARNARHILFGSYQDEWEVTPKELRVNQGIVLGYGFSGKVFLGHLKKQRNKELIEMDVAVKFSHAFNNQAMRLDLIKEIGFMKTLGKHPNLLIMVGYVKSIQEPAIATELCVYGDLLNILKKHELHFMSPKKCQKVQLCFLLPDLIKIALQICNGLIYLTSLKFVHRDIAARNVLLSKDLTAKVGDFGLCRLAEEYIYQDKGARIPIKNSSFEALKYGRFSEKSDVWSFGVLMWELFSGGKKPFDNIPVMSFVNYLDDENKLIFPEETPKQLSEIIDKKCFQKGPNKRATFVELKSDLYSFYSIVCSVLKEEERKGDDVTSIRSNCRSIRLRV